MSNDDYAYDQTPLMFDPNMGQPELDPFVLQLLQSMQYPTSNKGVPNPYNLQTQNLFQNAYQDRLSTLFDPANSLMTGGLSPAAFAPDVTEKQLDFPVTGSLMMQAKGTGLENLIAQYVLSGMSPTQAMLAIKRGIENAPADDTAAQDLKAALPRLPPSQYQAPGTETDPDWDAVTKMVSSVYDNYTTEQGLMARAQMPNSGVIERNGKFFQTTETPSAMTQMLKKQGLDNPFTQYNEDYVRQNNPDFPGIEQALQANFGDLINQRAQYSANDAERQRVADLQRKFTGQDQAAMDRFSRNVQNAMTDYYGVINQDMLSSPAYGGGRYIGDPTVMPQLGQRTPTQLNRDARLQEAMVPFRSFGAEGRIGATPESIRQALADYMSNASREPLTTVPGHPGMDMVGGAGREGPVTTIGGAPAGAPINNLPSYINHDDPLSAYLQAGAQASPGVSVRAGQALDPNLPAMPSLSAYSDPNQQARTAMAMAILGKMPMMGGLAAKAQRGAEQTGKLRAQGPKTSKQQDANRRTDAYKRTHAAQLAYAQAMLPAYLAAKAGRTPFQDQIAARAQSMFSAGAMG